MDFSFKNYHSILQEVSGYLKNSPFDQYSETGRLYLRHDVDIFSENVLNMAKIEDDLELSSIFFFQPNSNFYNMLSSEILKTIDKLNESSHSVGLHIDAHGVDNFNALFDQIRQMYDFYRRYIPLSKVLSFHRPPSFVTENFEIPDFTNVYGERYFKRIRYFSDSKRREFASELFDSLLMDKDRSIQLLTHPYWWDHVSLNLWEAWERFKHVKAIGFERFLRRDFTPYNELFDYRWEADHSDESEVFFNHKN